MSDAAHDASGASSGSTSRSSSRSSDAIAAQPFALRWKGAGDALEGARWWNESRRAWRLARAWNAVSGRPDDPSRRNLILAVGGVTCTLFLFNLARCISEKEDPEVSMEALKLQQQLGWNAGETDRRLAFGADASAIDLDGQPMRTEAMATLWTALRPVQPVWAPYYVPTLFRALADERSGGLRAQMQMIHTEAMESAFQQGAGIADVFSTEGAPSDVALVIDVPGPAAVALAAALSSRFEPVWLFDNWPHPLGVVASHAVLGAALYYLPLLERNAWAREARRVSPDAGAEPGPERGANARPGVTPPVFVLDSNRLAPYTDGAAQFDNRYLARLPSAAALKEAGYRRVLYVRPHGLRTSDLRELDDLNDDFVAYRDQDIDVRAVAADDFHLDPQQPPSSTALTYWGGRPHTHVVFWNTYGWSTRGAGATRFIDLAPGANYRPLARPTMFSTRSVGGFGGVGKQRPSGFGVVSVRQSASSGRITSVGSGRSGSFGRFGGSSFG